MRCNLGPSFRSVVSGSYEVFVIGACFHSASVSYNIYRANSVLPPYVLAQKSFARVYLPGQTTQQIALRTLLAWMKRHLKRNNHQTTQLCKYLFHGKVRKERLPVREALLGLRACTNTVSMAVVVRRISELKMRHKFSSRVNNCNSNANAHQHGLIILMPVQVTIC